VLYLCPGDDGVRWQGLGFSTCPIIKPPEKYPVGKGPSILQGLGCINESLRILYQGIVPPEPIPGWVAAALVIDNCRHAWWGTRDQGTGPVIIHD